MDKKTKKKNIKEKIDFGVSFGLTSGVITTLGLMVGIYYGTHSKLIVLGGILTIAFADAFSDSLGIHISKESEKGVSKKKVWKLTFSSFITKLLIALTFVIPVLSFNLNLALIISIIWGFSLISILSYKIAVSKGDNPLKVIGEHLFITAIVVIISNLIGSGISNWMG
ncbi:hypothetical protein K0A97_00240 [Patescibacteria group bacterium]|nr:hypothetical protein [Patescibacteria group bacterium]